MKSWRLAGLIGVVLMGCVDGPDTRVDEEAAPAAAESDGRPELSDDELDTLRAEEPEQAARALAEVETQFAQRDAGLTFRVHRSSTTRYGDVHVLVEQVYRGMPVQQRDILAIVGLDGSIRVLGKPDRFDGVSLPPPSSLDKAHRWAFGRGVKLGGASERWLQPVYERRLRAGAQGDNATNWENVVVGFDSGTRVAVDGGPNYRGARELFVRDRDGALEQRGLPSQAFAPADLRGYYARSTWEYPTTFVDDSGSYQLKDEYENTIVLGYNNLYLGPDNTWGDSLLYFGDGGFSTNGETAAADAMISVWATSTMYQFVYRQTVTPTTVIVHSPYVSGAQNSPTDGPNGGPLITTGYAYLFGFPKRPMTDVEVIGHEYGHLAMYEKLGLDANGSTNEMGGIIEGSADIFGLNAGFYLQSALHPRCIQHRVGPRMCTWTRVLSTADNWVFGDLSNQDNATRDFIDPKYPSYFNGLGYGDPTSTGSRHEAGGPLRRMYYFLSVGVIRHCPPSQLNCVEWIDTENLNAPQRESSYLPQGLTGIGVDAANKIWWQTFDGLYIANVQSYAEYREAMLAAAASIPIYGAHSTQYKAVEDAWAAVNVGPPADRTPPLISDLITSTQLTKNSPIEVSVADDHGIAKVEFFMSAPFVPIRSVGVATEPPWRVLVNNLPNTGQYTLTVEATDKRANKGTRTFYPLTYDDLPPEVTLQDVTPCSPATSEWCGDYNKLRRYRVTATDYTQVSKVTISVDTVPYSLASTSPYDFSVTFSVGGDHYLRGGAVDVFGNSAQTPYQLYKIDQTPPTLTRDVVIAQSQSSSGGLIEHLVEMDYCATDASGIALRSGKQRIDMYMDGAPITPEERIGYPAGCPSYYIRNVAVGMHFFRVRIYDRWGNFAERTSNVLVEAVKPFVWLEGVYVDPMVLGRITVNGFYNSYFNIASISEYLCTSPTWCTLEKQEGPPTNLVGPIRFHYENLHLTPGASYKARITVTGTNGTSTTVDSVWFTIPTTSTPPPTPSTDVVYFEHEPNDAYFYMFNLIGNPNVPPSNVNIIRGAASSGNSDMFRLTVQVPSNKLFCVAIAAGGWAPNIDLDVWYRRQGDGAMVSHPGTYTENTPAEITDDSYYCREPAVDNVYYLWVFGNAASVNYELRIKYMSMYPAAPPSSPN